MSRLVRVLLGDLVNTPPTLRWGILGCARIARRGLIPGISASQSGTLQALSSRSAQNAQAWAEEFGVPRAYFSHDDRSHHAPRDEIACRAYGPYHELLQDPQIDAVYIPLPNELHKPWVLAAADAGKHVLCEKPLARNAHEASVMVEHCERRGVILMEAFMWRHQPRALEIRALVAGGAIGSLRLVRSSFSFSIEPGDWRLDPSRGGGALWDVGCYGVSAARFFATGEPLSACASAHFGETGVDLTCSAILEFSDGLLAMIDCSFEQPFRCQYELVGTRGVIEVPDAYLPPRDARPAARLRTLAAASDSDARGDQVQTLQFESTNQYAAMVDAFARSVSAGRLVDPAEDGLAQMRVLDMLSSAARKPAGD